MKKIYSFVLMATALLIGTNAWAATRTASSATELENAWKAAENGDVIQLTSNVTMAKTLWLGTTTMNDASPKSITLDLNGNTLTAAQGTVQRMFIITHGELNVIGNGQIIQTGTTISSSYEIFRVCGSTYKNVNPKTATSGFYSHLNIGEGVTLTANSNAVVLDRMDGWIASAIATSGITTPSSKPYNTNVYTTDRGVANGARVDIYGTIFANKYSIKANGNMGSPSTASVARSGYYEDPDQTIAYTVKATDVDYSPFVYIHKSARLETLKPASTEAIAAYSGGYARWTIEGHCEGSTGVYVKSGEVVLNDATIKSNYTGTYVPAAADRTSGVDAGGSGIVMESSKNYAGDIDVTVQGDTKVSGSTGYAIDESVTNTAGTTKVDAITITGGTFESGTQGTMKVTEITAEAAANPLEETIITIIGATATEGSATIGDQTLADYLSGQSSTTHVTYVDDGKGGSTMIISEGAAPTVANSVIGATANTSIDWQNTGTTSETLKKDLTLDELQINQTYNQTLILGDPSSATPSEQKVTLKVERIVLGSKAQIIVNPGSKLIVTGTQGISAPSTDNIILKTSEATQAHFLFHPNVTSNRHPNATVEFTSKSYRQGGKNVYQRFGIPSYTNNVQLEYKDPSSSTLTYIQMWDYAADKWTESWVPVPAATGLNVGMSGPFGCFDLASNNAKAAPMTYLFKGGLVGNTDASMEFNNKFNPYANSYMAPIDIKTLVNRLAANYPELSAAVYVYVSLANDNYTWLPLAQSNFTGWDTPEVTEIAPMQAYMLYMIPGNTSNATVSYKDNVYDPYISGASLAPARFAKATKQNFLKLTIADESGIVFDKTRLLEDNQFSEEFDNGYDVNKYMNDKVSLYVTSQDEAWSTLASDNVLNSYIGVNVAKSGVYTISVAHNGLDYALVDLENNQVINLEEGDTYSFYQEAGKNDARFQVVKINKVSTAIDNIQNDDVLSTKFMKDGALYILKNGTLYNAQGQIVK